MKNYGIVHGSAEQAVPLIIGKDTVYVHTNINPIIPDPADEFSPTDLYSYEEIQYDKDEYIGLMSEKNIQLEADQQALSDAVAEIIMGV